MSFWGVKVKCDEPFTHSSQQAKQRLRVTQATWGACIDDAIECFVQCQVGNRKPTSLCAFIPNKAGSKNLDLEFEETDDVVFFVVGPSTVYLTGYYYVPKVVNINKENEVDPFQIAIDQVEEREKIECDEQLKNNLDTQLVEDKQLPEAPVMPSAIYSPVPSINVENNGSNSEEHKTEIYRLELANEFKNRDTVTAQQVSQDLAIPKDEDQTQHENLLPGFSVTPKRKREDRSNDNNTIVDAVGEDNTAGGLAVPDGIHPSQPMMLDVTDDQLPVLLEDFNSDNVCESKKMMIKTEPGTSIEDDMTPNIDPEGTMVDSGSKKKKRKKKKKNKTRNEFVIEEGETN